jgi:hypothetical protein
VKGVVGDSLLGLLVPLGQPVEERLVAARDHEVDDRRRPPGDAGGRACLEIVGALGPHEGQLHVHVRVDAARENDLPGGVDDRVRAALLLEPGADGDDLAVRAVHVAHEPLGGRDDLTVLDQDTHDCLPTRTPEFGGE